ncbi:MAG: hypothetical protein ACI8RZ_004100 [Myxococcota bacterium]|jgi:hypothetical protein
MNGHVFLWRIGPATLLLYAQPALGLVPVVMAWMLLQPLLGLLCLLAKTPLFDGLSFPWLFQWDAGVVALVLLVAAVPWMCLTTGTALLIRPSGVRSLSALLGVVVRCRRISLNCEVIQEGGFDFDEVVLRDSDTMLCIETTPGNDGPLAEEIRRALGRARQARFAPNLHGPRPIKRPSLG